MFSILNRVNLITQIVIALILGILVAFIAPDMAKHFTILGDLFIKALKSVAPILVFILVLSAVSNYQASSNKQIRSILILYLVGTVTAAATAVLISQIFPSTLNLQVDSYSKNTPPSDVWTVLRGLITSFIDNPINALMTNNFIGILAWAIGLGIAIRQANETTKNVVKDLSEAVAKIIAFVIRLAPFGIFGLVIVSVAEAGAEALKNYLHVLVVLVGTMFFVALVINPILVGIITRKNPYPLVLTCLRESGTTAFFTRSSAANIPVNLNLAERMGVDKSVYSISIPLGATVNMAGAAVTVSILTMATVHTLGIQVDLATMMILSIVSAMCACGAAGVAGGSLLLIPLACSLFGINSDIAMQVITVGMIISVLQDSTETALNSSTDVLFTIAADQAAKRSS